MPDFVRANGRVHHIRFRPGPVGPAIIFANSLGTDLRIWDGVIKKLPSDIPILTYDKSGHGLSEAGAETIADLAQDLASLMDQFQLSMALVCGVSVGGMIAQTLASSRPDLVAALVLCNTSHRIGTPENWTERMALLEKSGLDDLADGILERWFASRFAENSPNAITGYRQMLVRTPIAGYQTVCAAIRDADLTIPTRQLTCPSLCIAGSDDLATPAASVKAMADLIDGSSYVCLPEVGHLPCIEAPDVLADLMLTHWKSLT